MNLFEVLAAQLRTARPEVVKHQLAFSRVYYTQGRSPENRGGWFAPAYKAEIIFSSILVQGQREPLGDRPVILLSLYSGFSPKLLCLTLEEITYSDDGREVLLDADAPIGSSVDNFFRIHVNRELFDLEPF